MFSGSGFSMLTGSDARDGRFHLERGLGFSKFRVLGVHCCSGSFWRVLEGGGFEGGRYLGDPREA